MALAKESLRRSGWLVKLTKQEISGGVDRRFKKCLVPSLLNQKNMNRLKFIVFAAVLLICGCFGSAAETTVNGTLSIGGQPVENVLVTFYPAENPDSEKLAASGLTNANGEFTLTRDDDEATSIATGNYLVTLTEGEVPVTVAASEVPLAEQSYRMSLAHRPLPVVYARHVDTPLKVDVVGGKTLYALEIQKKN